MDIQIKITPNENATLMVSFDPKEDTWKFKKKNKLKLFNQIHLILTNTYPFLSKENMTEEELNEMTDISVKNYAGAEYFGSFHFEIQKLLREWIARGDLAR